MGCPIGPNSFFPSSETSYIKFQSSNLVAQQGPNIVETLILTDLKMPYEQVVKGKIILKPGQVNYLFNNLGIGDNATVLAMAARYDAKSVIEEDNYVQYNYSDNMSHNLYFAQFLMLTGNSTHRIPQLYLSNPNPNYAVTIDAMIAVIDDTYSYYNDTINQSGLSLMNLEYDYIETYIPNESIVIYDGDNMTANRKALAYITLSNINSLEKSGRVILLDDSSYGKIFLEFKTQYDSDQAFSLLSYVMNTPNAVIQSLNPVADSIAPIIHFNLTTSPYGVTISAEGATFSGPYDSTTSFTYSTTLTLSSFTGSVITKYNLVDVLVDYVQDNRDGIMGITSSNVNLYQLPAVGTQSATQSAPANGSSIDTIVITGSYSVTFNIYDLAQNQFNTNTRVILNII